MWFFIITLFTDLKIINFYTYRYKLSQKAIRSVSGKSIKVFLTLKLRHFIVAFPFATGNQPGVFEVTGLPVKANCVQIST